MSAACRVASAPHSLRGGLDSKTSLAASLLRCGRLAVRVPASGRTHSRPSSVCAAKTEGTPSRQAMATSSADLSISSSPGPVPSTAPGCQPFVAFDVTASSVGTSDGPAQDVGGESTSACLSGRSKGLPSGCHSPAPDTRKSLWHREKPLVLESVTRPLERNRQSSGGRVCASVPAVSEGGYADPPALHLPTLLVGGSTGPLPEAALQPTLSVPRECPNAVSKATAREHASSWSPSNLHFMVLPVDPDAGTEAEESTAGKAVGAAREVQPANKESSLLGTPTQPQCARALLRAEEHKNDLLWKMKALALRSSAAANALTACGEALASSVRPLGEPPAAASSELATTQPEGCLFSSGPAPSPKENPNGCPNKGETDTAAADTSKLEATTNTGHLAKGDEASTSSTPVEQREWISLEDLKKLLREKLMQTATKPTGSCTRQEMRDPENSTTERNDTDPGSPCDNTPASNEACNAAQVLQEILKSRRIAAEDLECYPGKMPSLGALLHDEGLCKPCVFANKANKQCLNGVACLFCHHFHKEKRKRARKARPQRHAAPGVLPCPEHPAASPLLYRAPQRNCQPVRTQLLGLSAPYAPRAEPRSRISTYSELPALLPTAASIVRSHSNPTRKLQPPPPPPPPPPPEHKSSGSTGLMPLGTPAKLLAGICPNLLAVDSLGRRLVSPPQHSGSHKTPHSACVSTPPAREETWAPGSTRTVQEARGGHENLACLPGFVAERDENQPSEALRAALWPYASSANPGGRIGDSNCSRPVPPHGTGVETFRLSTALANTAALLSSQLHLMQRQNRQTPDQKDHQHEQYDAQQRDTAASTSILPTAQSGGNSTTGQASFSEEATLPFGTISDLPSGSDPEAEVLPEISRAAQLQLSEPPEAVDEVTMGALQRLNRLELLHLMDLIMCTLAIQTPFCGEAPARDTEACAPVEAQAVPSAHADERPLTGEITTAGHGSASPV
ncbi:aoe264 and aoe130 possible [Cystoisospora suis]|uniref:Aoe264 and aoe130 possible n=1 Tax=Cystoisospora suis TaxID=483139 RepID=A0A2C6KN84_9APIC|nr:aoe264 and aoe130 possible [Cystoisospora suis]